MPSSITITLTQRLSSPPDESAHLILALTAEERTRSRHRFETDDGQAVFLQLPRGTVLQDRDVLRSDDGILVQVVAKPEPVLTVTANFPLQLLQAAYHLGNRHVPLEITANYLRLAPDPVLQDLLQHRGLSVRAEICPFQPESGAYSNHAHGEPTH
jgi:urease accessory protein